MEHKEEKMVTVGIYNNITMSTYSQTWDIMLIYDSDFNRMKQKKKDGNGDKNVAILHHCCEIYTSGTSNKQPVKDG